MNVKKYSWIWPYLLITPALTVVICVVFIPVIEAVITSLKYHDLRYPDRTAWVGLQNYADLLTADAQFWPSLCRTILWVIFERQVPVPRDCPGSGHGSMGHARRPHRTYLAVAV